MVGKIFLRIPLLSFVIFDFGETAKLYITKASWVLEMGNGNKKRIAWMA